jgi:hypothetical protein
MSNLAQIQTAFATALINPGARQPAAVRGSERRFAVYRNNVAMGLLSALSTRYPVVKRLVGDEFFHEMARQYTAAEPPRSPIMLYYGDTFPAFIAAFEPAQPIPYLAAIARIEMARGLAYYAADAEPVRADAFASISPGALAGLRVVLHPSVAIISSLYPIHSIWKVNQNRAPVTPVSPWAPEAVLVARPANTVQVYRLAPGQAPFLRALAEGGLFSEAVEAAMAEAKEFDMTESLVFLIGARIVVGFDDAPRVALAS